MARRIVWGSVGLLAVAAGLVIWHFWPDLWRLMQDEEALEDLLAWLGWFGPLALILLNALQIVIAPVPGYAVMAAAGFLFGPFWGGVWGTLGLLAGATAAMWLSRRLGRPMADRLVGGDRLARWERVTHSENTVLWVVLLLGPIGDIPYFLAGLSRVSFTKILVLTLIVRAPTVFVVAAAGAGVPLLTWWQIALLVGFLLVLFALFVRYQDLLLIWFDRQVQAKLNLPPAPNSGQEAEQAD
jgi:uncharacterized membrane protein YdjX (TVP38/TMEM64 family)